jgi:hypothetical protein
MVFPYPGYSSPVDLRQVYCIGFKSFYYSRVERQSVSASRFSARFFLFEAVFESLTRQKASEFLFFLFFFSNLKHVFKAVLYCVHCSLVILELIAWLIWLATEDLQSTFWRVSFAFFVSKNERFYQNAHVVALNGRSVLSDILVVASETEGRF